MPRILCFLFFLCCVTSSSYAQIRVLIVDGHNNHVVWPKSTIMMKEYLEATGRFTVDVARTRTVWKIGEEREYLNQVDAGPNIEVQEPVTDPDFRPRFRKYDVVVSNFGWKAASWPKRTRKKFEKFVARGGGFVSVHAADNSFPEWPAYNKMIGLGGWGGRDENSGPFVYYDNDGKLIRDTSPGPAGKHGARHEFPITIREKNHPITQGMPEVWMTTTDECYAALRGPAEQMTILATGKDVSEKAPTDRHEPVLMVLDYGKGRIFHTTLGHNTRSFEGVGFMYSFLRGVEWAATGSVTQALPDDFPTATQATWRAFSGE